MLTVSSVRERASCRESDLVLQSARTFLSGKDDGSLKAALAQHLNWAAIERKTDDYSMTPLVAYVLKQYGGSLVPQEVRERLQKRLLSTARNNMALLAEWHQTLQAFELAGVSVISLKGLPLALLSYRNIALRECLDLDLLVKPSDVSRACEALAREGYQLRFPIPGNTAAELLRSRNCQLDFVNNRRGTLIDLHWGALHKMLPFQLPVEELFKSAQVARHEGISFLSLSPEHTLLYLCAHGAKHCWHNLRWLCDVACHVQTVPELDWELCIRSAETANCDLVMKHCLLLEQQVLGLDLPPSVSSYCEDAKAQALADRASSLLFRDDGDPGYGEGLRFHLAFAKGWRDRVTLVFERLFVPSELDWQEVRLPYSLRFLYYTVRPVRFMFQRFSRTNQQGSTPQRNEECL